MARTPTPTPPMGWNSWDCFGTTVTEEEVLANAEVLHTRLAHLGWDTVVVDIDWSDPTARSHGYNANAPLAIDSCGRLVPDPGRFPSAADGAGFGPLAAAVHELGLRFGIHTMRGIPRIALERDLPVLGTGLTASAIADPTNVCEWNPDMVGLRWRDEDPAIRAACQAYYDSTLELYASWGVDFIKADDMLWPYQDEDIAAYARAIETVGPLAQGGRPIELSLSPGRDLSLTRLDHLRESATMWRICDDLWDRWEDVEANFARFARWAPHASAQGWPDGDMLPLGRIGIRAERGEPRDSLLTPAEQRTLLTLWCVARSPLMVGGHLPASSPETLDLLSRPGVLALLHSSESAEVFREGDLVLWTAQVPIESLPSAYREDDDDDAPGTAGSPSEGLLRYVAAFNTGSDPLDLMLDAQNVALPATLTGPVTEVWTGATVPAVRADGREETRGVAPGSTGLPVSIEPHGVALLRYLDAR